MTALWSFALACFRSPKLKKDGKKAKKTLAETQPASNVEEGQTLISPIFASSRSLKRINPFPEEIISGFGSGQFNGLTTHFGPVGSSEIRIQENSYELENQKESESPRYQALLPMTSTPKKRFFGEIKSFSHELNSKGVRPFPLWKSPRSNNSKEILNSIRTKFDKAKEEVNSDLSIFAGDLLDVNNKYKETHPELVVAIEDLLVLAKKCATTTSGEFWLQCEGIVKDLDDKRQELSPGVLKKLHTRMLFILTRCSRLLQFHNESLGHKEPRISHSADMRVPTGEVRDERGSSAAKALKVSSTKKAYSQEQSGLNSKEGFVVRQTSKDPESSGNIDRMSPSPALKGVKEAVVVSKEQSDSKVEPPKMVKNRVGVSNDMVVAKAPYYRPTRLSHEHVIFVRQRRNISWGYWGNESYFSEETSIICRICEEEVSTIHVEEHSRICILADKYNEKVVSIDELLVGIAVTLEKITKSLKQKSSLAAVESQDPIELSFKGKGTFNDQNDISQMSKLAAIARSAANVIQVDEQSPKFLIDCLRDSIDVTLRRKFNALTVETFGTRIQKLIQEKYLQLGEILDYGKVNLSRTIIDENAPFEDGVVLSFKPSLVYRRDRTSIDDFKIIKLISSGAFGRVVLARKKTTKDLFAIKILKKADMIRKNAVESILSERNILSNVSNPFVVRFFYSFTCSKKLYLVMEYVNGGDLYSLLKQVVCLDESDARLYIAELVLALEYLHSKGIVHRDLKPDNLLIAHDGHIKLTDFGFSKVGLINSTDDLSSPSSSAKSLLVEEKPKSPTSEHKQSAVGTPDYLAPEILLGTGHGATSDWWSVGVILYELIVGMPPFNAEQPQEIFDNILNRDLQWPEVPDEMSHEAYDLIDRLLTEDPHQRLGARGAAEVKQHVFFKDTNWDTLAQQKATFVPDSKNPLDTSYFKCRTPRNYSDEQCFPTNENEDSSDDDNLNGERVSGFETSVSENDSFDNFSFKRHEEKEKKKGTFI